MVPWILAAIAILAAVLIVVLYRFRIRTFLNGILNRIDDAIAGKSSQVPYTESLDSAITERLNQFLSIRQEQTDQSQKERDILKTYLSDISHQTKTPLANIVLYSELLLEQKGLDEKSRKIAGKIASQAEHLNFLVKTLAKASYQELGMIAIHKEEVSVDGLILTALDSYQKRFQEKQIRADYVPSGLTCSCDFAWTKEALENLLDNAVKYSGEGTAIRIKVTAYEMFVRIDIADEGIGISEEEQGAIFQRFYRSAAVKDKEGLGIGLYLVREILIREEGYIEVFSAPGEGSTFSVFLRRQ